MTNSTTEDAILTYVVNHVPNFGRANIPNLQHSVLIPLKQMGIIAINPHPPRRGGVFIPCTADEVRDIFRGILERSNSQFENLRGVIQHTNLGQLLQDIINDVNNVINRL